MTRAILIGADVPKQYWPEAIKMANYLRNRTIQVQGTKKTPYELWAGHAADTSRLRVPFCRVWFHRREKDKLEPQVIKEVFMRYDTSRKLYRVMAKKNRKIYYITNPIFLENKRGFVSREPGEWGEETPEIVSNKIVPGSALTKIIPSGEAAAGNDGPANIDEIDTGTTPVQRGGVETLDTGVDRHDEPELPQSQEQSTPRPPEQASPGDPGSNTPEPRRSGRIRKPTQAAIESRETETLWHQPRTQSRREEGGKTSSSSSQLHVTVLTPSAVELQQLNKATNLAVALELHLYEYNAFRVNHKPSGHTIPLPKTYQEAVSDDNN
jgi:hypothetical protein